MYLQFFCRSVLFCEEERKNNETYLPDDPKKLLGGVVTL